MSFYSILYFTPTFFLVMRECGSWYRKGEYKFYCFGLLIIFKYLKTNISQSVFRVSVIRSTVDREGDFVITVFLLFLCNLFLLIDFFF